MIHLLFSFVSAKNVVLAGVKVCVLRLPLFDKILMLTLTNCTVLYTVLLILLWIVSKH